MGAGLHFIPRARKTTCLPLFFDGSPKVGLGLFSSIGISIAVELGLFILGVVVYMDTIEKNWAKEGFKVLEVIPGGSRNWQDIVILQRSSK
jgi:hypothetical protein